MLTRYVLLDLETAALPDAAQWLPKVEAPANYTKPITIEAYVAGETMKQLDRAGLDPDACQIVSGGIQLPQDLHPTCFLIPDEVREREFLELVWNTVTPTTPMLGYGLSWFDAGVLVRRSQILGVQIPIAFYRQTKYRHEYLVDLADFVTLNGMIDQKKGRGLDYHCKRLGIQVEDQVKGEDIARLWREGNLEAIQAHNRADMTRIRLLAERLGVLITSAHQPIDPSGASSRKKDKVVF